MLVIKKVKGGGNLGDPSASAWKSVSATMMELKGTPIGAQPTPYTRTAWKDRKIGAIPKVELRLAHDGESLYARLEWVDATENRDVDDNNQFPDGAAVLFPVGRDAPINTMGNEKEWVNGWHWRADQERGQSVVAHGVGTTEPTSESVTTTAVRKGDRWQVVISRKLVDSGSGKTSVGLAAGRATRIGVAVWEGSNGERAGFKAFTENWTDIELAEAQ